MISTARKVALDMALGIVLGLVACSTAAYSQSGNSSQWQVLPRSNRVAPAIKSPAQTSPLIQMFPTVRAPAIAPSRHSSRSLDWMDLGNEAKIRAAMPANADKETRLMPDSDQNLESRAPRKRLYQLDPGVSSGGVTGAQAQPLMSPAHQAAQPREGAEISLGRQLKLPASMNIALRSLDFRETSVTDALRSLAALINLNLMLSTGIQGTVTVLFSEVTVEEAFNTLLSSFDLAFSWEGNILRIYPMANAPLVTTIFNIQNTNAAQVKEIIDKLLTEGRGKTEIDARTNSLVVTDTQMKIDSIRKLLPQIDVRESAVEVVSRPMTEVFYLDYVDANNLTDAIQMVAPSAAIRAYSSSQASQAGAAGGAAGGAGRSDMMIITDTQANLDKIREMVEKLDVAPVQVTIDAHIYEIDLNEEERLGINWQKQIPIAGTTENIFSAVIAPEEATTGGTGVFRFGSLSVNQFQALLAMLKTHTFAKVLSNPVITTLNNRQANITVGQAIPYVSASQVNAETGQVTSTIGQADANITLLVTPSVTGNDEVFLDIQPTISSVLGFTTLGGNQTPNLSNRSAQTQVIVKNNHTIVIGGMIKTDKSESITKVPFLGDLPGIGKMFQKKTWMETRTELIIFITPHIIRQPGSRQRPVTANNPLSEAVIPRISLQQ